RTASARTISWMGLMAAGATWTVTVGSVSFSPWEQPASNEARHSAGTIFPWSLRITSEASRERLQIGDGHAVARLAIVERVACLRQGVLGAHPLDPFCSPPPKAKIVKPRVV